MGGSQAATKPVPKERVRGAHLRVLVKRANGVPFERALVLVEEANGVMASNRRMDRALVDSDEWKQVIEGLWCWTGTMTGYREPGEKLGDKLEYADPNTGHKWIFPVPKDYRGERDAVLVAEHPDYELKVKGDERTVEVPDDKVAIVLAFPANDGWYLVDSKYGIPTGEQVDSSNSDARYLYQTDKRVGPVARGYFGLRRGVGLGLRPSVGFGVVVEASEAGSAQLEAGSSKLRLTAETATSLSLEGSPEQVQQALRVLRSQNLL